MNGLFIVGNKRSGSTHLMRLLNLHPEVFISNESDIVWILYNFHKGIPIKPYPHDSPGGFQAAIKTAESILDKNLSPLENYERFQKHLMRNGFLKMKGVEKEKLSYIGDQKPYQNIDPELMPFILELFPNAKFLHILRHPFEVVESSMKFAGGTGGHLWKGMSGSEIMDKWEMHENWVHEAKAKYGIDLKEVRYNRLITNPKSEMEEVFKFLNLEYDAALIKQCDKITLKNYKPIKLFPVSESQEKMLKSYGMKISLNYANREVIPPLKNFYHKVLRKFSA